MENRIQTQSSLTLENRNTLSLTGIKKIKSTEPNQVIAILDTSTIIILGQNLSVQNVSLTEGILEINGQISQIKYTQTQSKRFSIKNIFR